MGRSDESKIIGVSPSVSPCAAAVPEPSPNRNVQVTDLPGERSPVSAVRKAHGFGIKAGPETAQLEVFA